jgi:LacI family transcriptional regulator
MVRQETRTIGLIVPDNVNPFFAEIAQGIEDHGFDAGYSVLLCNSNRRATKEVTYIDMLISKRIDGVIYMTTDVAQERLLPFQASRIPVVAFNRAYDQADAILLDNFQGGYDATHHLIELGHRRIGCIAGPDSAGRSSDRVRGCHRALEEARLNSARAPTIQARDWSYESGKDAVAEMMASSHALTAIFACNDTLAIGAMSWLQENGLRLPDDVSIVGYDNIRLSAFTSPRLTTMATPIVQLGTRLCQMLLDRIAGKLPPEPQRVIVYSQLLVRASTAPPTWQGNDVYAL